MIYITTHHRVLNFGATLQAYALQNTLDGMGYDNKLIRIEPQNLFRKKNMSERIYGCFQSAYRFVHKREVETGLRNFDEFYKNFHRTTATYKNLSELRANPPAGDVYLTGSDQVFNPIEMEPMFFLQFGEKNVKRISYAGSVAAKDVPEEKKRIFREYLSHFDRISIRESLSLELMKAHYDKEIDVHVDPSFLVEKTEWEKMCTQTMCQQIKHPYVLVYVLYRPKWLNVYLKKLRKETGYEIITLSFGSYRHLYSTKTINNAGPREFLELVKNAKMVISSSYHGCVFSAIFRKPFYAILNPASPARIQSMLELFHLRDRILTPKTKVDFDINYNYFEEKLPEEIERAKRYLQEAIEG